MTPAVPSTPAQHNRYARMLQVATAMLASGGEEALQMKELADRAAFPVDLARGGGVHLCLPGSDA